MPTEYAQGIKKIGLAANAAQTATALAAYLRTDGRGG